MAGGLAAFFGVPLGGAIFACEVLHRNGLEYHEALVPATISGIACNLVFRVLCSLPETAIWKFAGNAVASPIPQWATILGVPLPRVLPTTIGNLRSLQKLDLSENRLQELPYSICELSEEVDNYLRLQDEDFTIQTKHAVSIPQEYSKQGYHKTASDQHKAISMASQQEVLDNRRRGGR